MPKKRRKRAAMAASVLLKCPLCTRRWAVAGDLTVHLTKAHTLAQLAEEITRVAVDLARYTLIYMQKLHIISDYIHFKHSAGLSPSRQRILL